MAQSYNNKVKAEKAERVKEIIKRGRRTPIFLYNLNERISNITKSPTFPDAILVLIAFFSAAAGLLFYPLIIMVLIAIVLFFVTLRKPFIGLILLLIAVLPMVIYQLPGVSWLFLLAMAASLIYGYMYYRTMFFLYAMLSISFSPAGYLFAIPLFLISILMVGYKRAFMISVVFVLLLVMLSGVSGVPNTAYIIYNSVAAHAKVGQQIAPLLEPYRHGLNIFNFKDGLGNALAAFTSGNVIGTSDVAIYAMLAVAGVDVEYYLAQLIVMLILVFGIEAVAAGSRSKYKGTYATIIGVGYALFAYALSFVSKIPIPVLPLAISMVIAVGVVFILEFFNVKIVYALDIRKQDLRMKFGEAFEDLEASNVTEDFNDIGNYESVKKELKDSVLAPIEEKGISKAYNVKPAKGILLFGPPGTGKTVMMRALANEIRAGFFYVKASDLISAFPGETEKLISNIFKIAKKNAPCILFFDEVDSITGSRQTSLNETTRQALSQLLIEMDGFQQINNVTIVGATNAPELMDPAIMRPGRFDKIIYMPPPDLKGRKKIFEIYLKKLPVSEGVDLAELADKTERFTGADIKALCENVAQKIAQEAASKHKVLEITQDDILDTIKSTKPSVSIAQIEMYHKFRLDFERSVYGQTGQEEGQEPEEINLNQVIGLDDAKKVVSEAIELPLMHPELLKKYKIKTINGVLLFGPPGTGKTMMLRAIKNEMKGATLLELDGADIAEQGMERMNATIKEAFDRARENSPAIILLDEVEELLLKRSDATEYSAQVTSEMLRQIDGISKLEDVIVVGATNRPDAIDPAALRPGRFDKLVFIKPPNKTQRADMFKSNLTEIPLSDDVSFNSLADATPGYTGADIYHVCREAKTAALEKAIKSGDEEKITADMLKEIIDKTRASAPEQVVAQYLAFYAKYGER